MLETLRNGHVCIFILRAIHIWLQMQRPVYPNMWHTSHLELHLAMFHLGMVRLRCPGEK